MINAASLIAKSSLFKKATEESFVYANESFVHKRSCDLTWCETLQQLFSTTYRMTHLNTNEGG